MDPEVLHQAPLAALAATAAFFLLAFLLLYPVWRFLNREEEVSRHWTPEEIARAQRTAPHGNGKSGGPSGNDEPGPTAR